MYLYCVGKGSPTVVLSAGFGGSSDNWSAVQPQLAHTTRACAYDRAGSGYSPANSQARDVRSEVDDLQRALDDARVGGPYVLVGHSYGGLVARLFAHAHPDETAGMVLVDADGPQPGSAIRTALASAAATRAARRAESARGGRRDALKRGTG